MNFLVTIDWYGIDLEATGVYYPGDPGRVSGPPERCYPPEPAEGEVTSLTYQDEQKDYDMMPLIQSDFGDSLCDRIMEAVIEQLCQER